jgi:hypothetical protein
MKKNFTWNLDTEVVEKVRQKAKKERRSLSFYVLTMFEREAENE